MSRFQHTPRHNAHMASGANDSTAGPSPEFRIERDPLGEFRVPAHAYYGIQTARALDNFPISGLRAAPELVEATIQVKKAVTLANVALGRLETGIGNAIVAAADEVLAGA